MHILMLCNKLPYQQKNHLKTPYILCLSTYISITNSVTHFLLPKSDQQAKTKLSAKLKKFPRADSQLPSFFKIVNVPMNLFLRFFFNFAESFSVLVTLQQQKMGVTEFVFEIYMFEDKIEALFRWLFCCSGNPLRHINECILLSIYWCFIWYHNITIK